ncbi:hypothetical protein H1Z61_00665 [Bacillus aquiflavi]|uniref:Transporter n=1 Tax=Bacillus aquiflavi TaxID=2672567 RepID=A0A6B3VX19_9BACI|nr:hypothetical protein [Bacillus aquiflavi]MBA4535680.1 hypothetical protein [Bacillus aquiflavi]NEY80056.1 hypothetical protein [Bacillus aquiflavi]
MGIELTITHWIYLIFIGFIIGFMVFRKDTTLICMIGIFLISILTTKSLDASISSIFNGFIYAITELLSTILIISIIVAMSNILIATGINDIMIAPFTKLIRTPVLAYWVIGITMMIISLFFWPSPAVALMGAVLLPVALKVGLPAIGVAMAMNLFGHGIALSGDFIIQAAPKLTADAAGLPVNEVMAASVPLIVVMGLVTTVTAFLLLKKEMRKGYFPNITKKHFHYSSTGKKANLLTLPQKRFFALLIPLLFGMNVAAMFILKLQGSDATALIGGTSILIIVTISLISYKNKGLEKITNYFITGFQFGFKVFGPVIPIAAFFYLGGDGFSTIIGDFLPESSNGIVNDLSYSLAGSVPLNKGISMITVAISGIITGLDGSGFSGLSLIGSISGLFGAALNTSAATLTALGQVATIWVGGGTLIPWALIPAAAICNVDPFELARRNLVPVATGLIVTTIVALFLA